MAEELMLSQKSYDLCKWRFEHTGKFPKSYRFSCASSEVGLARDDFYAHQKSLRAQVRLPRHW